jgi:hypothetical protein
MSIDILASQISVRRSPNNAGLPEKCGKRAAVATFSDHDSNAKMVA